MDNGEGRVRRGKEDGYVSRFYGDVVCAYPGTVLVVFLLLAAGVMWFIPEFDIEASGDTLLMQENTKLQYYRKISHRYDRREFVIVTYQPDTDLLSPSALNTLRNIRDDLRTVDGVSSVVSILDVPLLKNPPGPLRTLQKRIKTLSSPEVDKALARSELKNSPLYSNSLVSSDFTATAIKVNFEKDERYESLKSRRFELRRERRQGKNWTERQARELNRVSRQFEREKKQIGDRRRKQIARIRAVVNRHAPSGETALGGVPVIVDHIISYIKYDLRVFGVGILAVVALMLALMFRRFRWVIFPLLTCLISGLLMIGLLGLLEWNVTVVSSNFISLQLIFTMALVIHIVVRYCERMDRNPGADNQTLVRGASNSAFIPCLYAVMTTCAGFSSLLISDLQPVVSFGWIMIVGVFVSLVVTFLFLPAVLAHFERPTYEPDPYQARHVTAFFGWLTERYRNTILVAGAVVFAVTLFGVTQLRVENSFVNYFRPSTDVYKSLKFIDRKLGGTTPLQVIVQFKQSNRNEPEKKDDSTSDSSSFSGFGDYTEPEESERRTYWYTVSKLEKIERVHDELDKQEEVGKVRSLATLWKVGKDLHGGPLDTLGVQLLFDEIPDEFQGRFLDHYVSVEHNQALIDARIKDSLPSFDRDQFLKQLRTNLVEEDLLEKEDVRITGMFVLFNDLLQSLFRSQMNTIGVTVLLITVMMLILFRSLSVALVAVVPNVVASSTVLGIMGLAGFPLDLMTITIVAISVGIALDDTIHYLHRFQHELEESGDYLEAMHRSHGTIGNALTYTTVIIVAGFAILVTSKFIPTVLFGVLTALAMVVALVSALTLLPALVLLVRPFGEHTGS